MAGLVLCKGVCTFISGKTSMRLYFAKEDVGLRVLDRVRKNFKDVSLDMAVMLLRVQQLFPNLMAHHSGSEVRLSVAM